VRALRQNGQRVAVLKPVATGARRVGETWQSDDADRLIAAAQPPSADPIPLERVAPFLFEEPLAPSLAARRAGHPLTLDMLRKRTLDNLAWWSDHADLAVVEGVGGLLCPLAEDGTVLDLAEALDYPLLVVARFALGTLNHTLMTVRLAQERGLRVCGVLLNQTDTTPPGVAGQTASEELSRFLGQVPILGENEFQHDSTLLCPAVRDVDWIQRVRTPRL
ncbi:MAG TPA: dethiobiotin synthase, partial [Isosphaeraceae bacterium]|nr:dethiobiotin synthase [Isosphaeraceae bacterium]